MNLNKRWWHAFLPKRQPFVSGKKKFSDLNLKYLYNNIHTRACARIYIYI